MVITLEVPELLKIALFHLKFKFSLGLSALFHLKFKFSLDLSGPDVVSLLLWDA